MSIRETDKTLPSNRLIFELRRNSDLHRRLLQDPEAVMRDYRLSDEEQRAWRTIDLKRLGELGVHPYFLPQLTRLFKGSGYNHNNSDAARLYAEKLLK